VWRWPECLRRQPLYKRHQERAEGTKMTRRSSPWEYSMPDCRDRLDPSVPPFINATAVMHPLWACSFHGNRQKRARAPSESTQTIPGNGHPGRPSRQEQSERSGQREQRGRPSAALSTFRGCADALSSGISAAVSSSPGSSNDVRGNEPCVPNPSARQRKRDRPGSYRHVVA